MTKGKIIKSKKSALIVFSGTFFIMGIAMFICFSAFTTSPKEQPMPVQTTPSGLQYQILTPAPKDAKKPKAGQKVVVHYTGWLDDNGNLGKKFDSSYDRKETFTFVVGKGQVIKGWDESLLSMHVGEKRRVTIPPALAYGPRGIGTLIPPYSTLIFEIELIEIH